MPRKTAGYLEMERVDIGASMRPRPDAAENRAGPAAVLAAPAGFNEAAARCRGKPRRAP